MLMIAWFGDGTNSSSTFGDPTKDRSSKYPINFEPFTFRDVWGKSWRWTHLCHDPFVGRLMALMAILWRSICWKSPKLVTMVSIFQHLSTSFNIFQPLSTSFNLFEPWDDPSPMTPIVGSSGGFGIRGSAGRMLVMSLWPKTSRRHSPFSGWVSAWWSWDGSHLSTCHPTKWMARNQVVRLS